MRILMLETFPLRASTEAIALGCRKFRHIECIKSKVLRSYHSSLARGEADMTVFILLEKSNASKVCLPVSQQLLAQIKHQMLDIALGFGRCTMMLFADKRCEKPVVLGQVGIKTHYTDWRKKQLLRLLTHGIRCHRDESSKLRDYHAVMTQKKMFYMSG